MNNPKTIVVSESISKIIKYVIPKVQRSLNENHIANMVQDQKQEYEKHRSFSMLQSITVARLSTSGEIYVLDGHHRIKTYAQLEQEGYPINDVVVPVILYNVDTYDEMIAYYNRINKNMPIHPLEVCPTYADYERQLLTKITEAFKCYIKEDGKLSRCPHISMSELKKHIHGRSIGKKLQQHGKSMDEFWYQIIDLNAYIQQNVKSGLQLCPQMRKKLSDCEVKAEKNNCNVCYLGIWRKFEWLDICLVCILNSKKFEEIDITCIKNERTRIPIRVREEIWKKTNRSICDQGQCYVCSNDLSFLDMECSHIVAHALGGANTVDNLVACCKACNRDMGIMNLFEYKAMYETYVNIMSS